MGVYVTGDTHGDCTRIIEYARSHFLDAHDTVIVAGDFGCVWKGSPEENRRLDHLSESLDCRLAFVSGNHENFDILNNKSFYPHEIWSGGHVQHIRKISPICCGAKCSVLMGSAFYLWWCQKYRHQRRIAAGRGYQKLLEKVLALEKKEKKCTVLHILTGGNRKCPLKKSKRRASTVWKSGNGRQTLSSPTVVETVSSFV